MKLDFCVSHNYTQRDPSSLPPSTTTPAAAASTTTTAAAAATTPAAAAVEIPPKTRYKQKQNETHYENSTHFIHLTLSKVEIPPLEYYTTYPKTP